MGIAKKYHYRFTLEIFERTHFAGVVDQVEIRTEAGVGNICREKSRFWGVAIATGSEKERGQKRYGRWPYRARIELQGSHTPAIT
jgi:hypothetical protein